MSTKSFLVYTSKITGKIPINLLPVSTETNLPKFVVVPISIDFNEMIAGAVFPDYGSIADADTANYIQLPPSERVTNQPLLAQYKPIEIKARLVNSSATPLTFDFVVAGLAIPALDISYSPTLISYPIPTINQISTNIARIQIGVSNNALNKALEAYVIYELI